MSYNVQHQVEVCLDFISIENIYCEQTGNEWIGKEGV